jgi:hypothetical protein
MTPDDIQNAKIAECHVMVFEMMAAPSITDEVDHSTLSVALQGSIKEYPKTFGRILVVSRS